LKIYFVGTGSGKTSLNRFHSSILIAVYDFNLLIDAGDSVSRALLNQGISFNTIDGILISHLHPDHFGGFTSLIVQMKMNNRVEPLKIFIHQTLAEIIRENLSTSYIFKERLGFEIQYVGFDFEQEIEISKEFRFIGRKNKHLEQYEKYNSKLSYACCSFLFNEKDNNIFYSGDIGSLEDLFLFKNSHINTFITETTHVNFNEIIEFSNQLKPGKIILTHLTDEDIPVLKSKLKNTNSDRILLAADGMQLSV
jgi:ribonuclease Z